MNRFYNVNGYSVHFLIATAVQRLEIVTYNPARVEGLPITGTIDPTCLTTPLSA